VTYSLKDLLFDHFTAWQQKSREVKTVKDFSNYVGVDYKILDHLFNGRRGLSPIVAEKLARKLDDLRFYDLAKVTRPDPTTWYITQSLAMLDEEGKREVANEIAKYIEKRSIGT
jgi:hypothetical protein